MQAGQELPPKNKTNFLQTQVLGNDTILSPFFLAKLTKWRGPCVDTHSRVEKELKLRGTVGDPQTLRHDLDILRRLVSADGSCLTNALRLKRLS